MRKIVEESASKYLHQEFKRRWWEWPRRKASPPAPAEANAPLVLSGIECGCGERQLYTCERERCLFCGWCTGKNGKPGETWDEYIQCRANLHEMQSKP